MSAINLKSPPRATFAFGAFVTAAAADAGNRVAAFALGDGSLRLVPLAGGEPESLALHAGAVLALAAHPAGGFVTAGDDGRVQRVTGDGVLCLLAEHRGQWIEQLAVGAEGEVGYALGREIRRLGSDGGELPVLGPCPSTIAGLDRRGNLLAAAHYNGVTVWDLAAAEPAPRSLVWKGSHIAVALSPDLAFVVTGTQENEVHGWRLANGSEMRMSGYPAKVRSLAWSHDSTLLATSGNAVVVAWPFDGAGPEGRDPIEIADAKGALATRVACHPSLPLIAGGYASGWISLTDGATRRGARFQLARDSAVSSLAWSGDGAHLLAGSEDGHVAIFSDRSLAR